MIYIILLVLIFIIFYLLSKKLFFKNSKDNLKNLATEIKGSKNNPIYIIDNFLSNEECNSLIEELKNSLEPSTISRYKKDFRTSQTAHFKNTFLQYKIDKKIKSLVNSNKCEISQLQYYQVGNQFKPHMDAFHPEYDKEFYEGGQRSWTVMVYLNDVEEGGETKFNNLGEIIVPKKGKAVAWYNLNKNNEMDQNTMHEGCPVTKGEKYIITKWFKL